MSRCKSKFLPRLFGCIATYLKHEIPTHFLNQRGLFTVFAHTMWSHPPYHTYTLNPSLPH